MRRERSTQTQFEERGKRDRRPSGKAVRLCNKNLLHWKAEDLKWCDMYALACHGSGEMRLSKYSERPEGTQEDAAELDVLLNCACSFLQHEHCLWEKTCLLQAT